MQSKLENFNHLRKELKIETAQNLSNGELVNLSMASKYHLSLFQPLIDVRKLLHHVTRGEHDVVNAMLKRNISLILKKDIVTDCSGRAFENISGFEYALWALDKHMWTAMIECIPHGEEGCEVFVQLIAQYRKVSSDGVTYKLNGKRITEQHFDFNNTIIKELQTQVDSIYASGAKNWTAIDKQWRDGVGSAQNLFPAHVVYEFCSNAPFDPVPDFTSKPKSSKRFYNWATEKDETWFSSGSKLSFDFAIFKGRGSVPAAAYSSTLSGDIAMARLDLAAMSALCEVRVKDFIALNSQLEDQIKLDNRFLRELY